MPEYFQILYESGIRKVFMIGMHVRDRMIGFGAYARLKAIT